MEIKVNETSKFSKSIIDCFSTSRPKSTNKSSFLSSNKDYFPLINKDLSINKTRNNQPLLPYGSTTRKSNEKKPIRLVLIPKVKSSKKGQIEESVQTETNKGELLSSLKLSKSFTRNPRVPEIPLFSSFLLLTKKKKVDVLLNENPFSDKWKAYSQQKIRIKTSSIETKNQKKQSEERQGSRLLSYIYSNVHMKTMTKADFIVFKSKYDSQAQIK